MSAIDVMINPEKYAPPLPRLIGELDEQYKLRFRAYMAGQESRQAEIDELQKRIDEALEAFEDGSFNYCQSILKGNQNEN